MPFFVVFGALSDRIGRKKIMMAGCLLAAVSYLPIYHGDAAARRVGRRHRDLAAESGDRRDQPHAADDGRRRAARRPRKCCRSRARGTLRRTRSRGSSSLLVFIQVVFVTMVYGPIAAYLVEAFPAQDPLHGAVAAVPHRQRRLRRPAAAHRPVGHRANTGNIYAGSTTRSPSRRYVRRGIAAAEGDAQDMIWDEVGGHDQH